MLGRCPARESGSFHLPREHVRTTRFYLGHTPAKGNSQIYRQMFSGYAMGHFSAVTSCRLIGEQTVRQPSPRTSEWTKENSAHVIPYSSLISRPRPKPKKEGRALSHLPLSSSSRSRSETATRVSFLLSLPVFLPLHHIFLFQTLCVGYVTTVDRIEENLLTMRPK